MTKPPQQTIGNTVYTVGQKLNWNDAGPLLDYMKDWDPKNVVRIFELSNNYLATAEELEYAHFPITVTALPDPDPVEAEWREVSSCGHWQIKDAMTYPYIRIDWPEWSAAYRKYGAYTELDKQTKSRSDYCYECEKFLIRAVALGGKVSVKGGVQMTENLHLLLTEIKRYLRGFEMFGDADASVLIRKIDDFVLAEKDTTHDQALQHTSNVAGLAHR